MKQILLLSIIAAIVFDMNTVLATIDAKQFENEDNEEKFRLFGPRNVIMRPKTFLRLMNNGTGTNRYCDRDIAILEDALDTRELWALKMLDASSKIPSGMMEGNIIDFGMFDECINVNGESQGVEIHGRHCMYSIASTASNASLPINPTFSICMPSTCNATDVVYLINDTINEIAKWKDLQITVLSATCALDQKTWDTPFIVCLMILVLFIGCLIFCTAIDVALQRRDAEQYRHPVFKTLAKFSLIKSASSILSMNLREGNLPALHGLRSLSMGWVILGHEYILHIIGVNTNVIPMGNWIRSAKSLYIFTAPFAVDTFFTLSGFLMTYLFLKQMPREKTFNIPVYYLHRYLRLTPPIIALIIFTIVFIPKVGSGPHWDAAIDFFRGTCSEKWWAALLYVQTYANTDQMCLPHLWYLSVDMQLFWISPIILYPLYKKPKFGLAIVIVLLLASIVTTGTIVGINKYRAFSFVNDMQVLFTSKMLPDVYEKPYTRAGPWLLGIILGHDVVNNNRRLGKYAVVSGWLVATVSFAFCIFGTRYFMRPAYVYNIIWETTFTAVSRPVWAIGICWVIYACLHNHAGPVSTFLSWKYFLPLSRISYSVYLVHILIQLMQISALRFPYYFTDWYIWRDFITDLILAVIVGFFFSLLFESPIMVLDKMVFRRKRENINDSQRTIGLSNSKDEEAP